jgi:hypothetical protein
MKPIIFSLLIIPILLVPLAYATNESDYKHGYKAGLWEYHRCYIGHFCAVSENVFSSDCSTAPTNLVMLYKPVGPPMHYVQNVTACNDGYNHGWIKECLKNGGVNCKARHIDGPVIAAITGPGHCYNTTKEGEACESGNFTSIH